MTIFGKERLYAQAKKHQRTATNQPTCLYHSLPAPTAIAPIADPSAKHAHDAYHRFFAHARWSVARLWQLLAKILIQAFCPDGTITLALDDSLFHRSGRKIDGAGWWRDAVRSTKENIVYAWDLNLVVLTLQVQPPSGGEPLGLVESVTSTSRRIESSYF